MKTLAPLLVLAMTIPTGSAANSPDSRFYEMRVYYAAPGKLDALNARFRNHTCRLFEKHGMQNIGYWMPVENPDNRLIYVLAYPNREARETAWKNFMADPAWQKVRKESEADGRLVARVESTYLTATDYSPAIRPAVVAGERLFELRTYKCEPGRLAALHDRFRQHTLGLFSKHGMTHIGYWTPVEARQGAADTLIYILAHRDQAARDASFKAFRADPDWLAALKASEQKAGGSLTVSNGVTSVMMRATDYSPIR